MRAGANRGGERFEARNVTCAKCDAVAGSDQRCGKCAADAGTRADDQRDRRAHW
jgi:hypothetical protein